MGLPRSKTTCESEERRPARTHGPDAIDALEEACLAWACGGFHDMQHRYKDYQCCYTIVLAKLLRQPAQGGACGTGARDAWTMAAVFAS
eukprot:7136891-Lingulodinium_polyedra.AAC.1